MQTSTSVVRSVCRAQRVAELVDAFDQRAAELLVGRAARGAAACRAIVDEQALDARVVRRR
jgi:hypothetical protein